MTSREMLSLNEHRHAPSRQIQRGGETDRSGADDHQVVASGRVRVHPVARVDILQQCIIRGIIRHQPDVSSHQGSPSVLSRLSRPQFPCHCNRNFVKLDHYGPGYVNRPYLKNPCPTTHDEECAHARHI